MTRIESSRIAEIFRTLDSKRGQNTERPAQVGDEPNVQHQAPEKIVRDKEILSRNLRQKIIKLKKESENFDAEAPILAVTEILVWEFGDNILNHPDFQHIAKSVKQSIESSQTLHLSMASLIDSLLKED